MTSLEVQIIKTQEKLSNLREQKRLAKLRNKKASQPEKTRGRPKISEDVLIKAVQMAETKPLAIVAIKLEIGLTTLYNYGISRARLENKTRC
jgi:hypothetical protein